MASSWLNSWLNSWGNSWGVRTTNQGGSGPKRKKRKKDTRFADTILRNRAERDKKAVILQPKITVEPFDDSALRAEFEQITKSIADKKAQLELRQISQYQYEEFVRGEDEALQILMMALELDRDVILQIIT